MITKPLVSVLMTSFNREQFISEAISCVLASTYETFELIIVDDGSTDKTAEIARTYELQDARIRLYVNKENLGQFPNRNKAASYAKGKYIYYADSDDRLSPEGLAKLVSLMEAFPECHFAMYHPHSKQVCVKQPGTAIRDHFFKKPFLSHGPGGTFIEREYFIKIGGYPEEFGIPGDMYFNLKAACYSPILLIPFQFMEYRLHEQQEINDKYNYLYNNYKYLNAALSDLPLPLTPKEIDWLQKKNKRRFAVNITMFFLKHRNVAKTHRAIRLAGFGIGDAFRGVFH